MASYSNFSEAIDEIKSRANIVDVIGKDVQLKRAGANYKGLCPFHGEKTPSFIVSEQKQIFTCFGCGASGDVIKYVQLREGLDFSEAVAKLAGIYGVELKERRGGAGSEQRKLLYEINREAAVFFYRALRRGDNPALSYLRKRGLSNETMKAFGLGYADGRRDSLFSYLKSKGYEEDKLLTLGLVNRREDGSYYDKFRDRAIFPIINTQGNIIGFGGRALGDFEPKYLNSPESPVFMKKNNLYALNLSRSAIGKEDRAVLVEGYMDVIALYQAGIQNVSASLGTALTENQARLLSRYTKNVTLSYDADSAGRAAALRGIDILEREGLRVRVLHVTDGKDPDEFVKKNGSEAFRALLKDASLSSADYRLEHIREQHDLKSEDGRLEYVREAAAFLASLSPAEAELYSAKVAEASSFSLGAVERETENARARLAQSPRGRKAEYAEHNHRDTQSGGENNAPPPNETEKLLVKLIFMDPKRLSRLDGALESVENKDISAIISCFSSVYSESGELSPEKLNEKLENEQSELLKDILDKTRVSIDEEVLFDDCKTQLRIIKLRKRQEEAIVKMEMLDASMEEEGREAIEKLNREIMEIQTELQALSRQRGGRI